MHLPAVYSTLVKNWETRVAGLGESCDLFRRSGFLSTELVARKCEDLEALAPYKVWSFDSPAYCELLAPICLHVHYQ